MLRPDPKERRSQASLALAVLVHAAVGGIVWSLALLPAQVAPEATQPPIVVERMLEPHRASPGPRGDRGSRTVQPRKVAPPAPAPEAPSVLAEDAVSVAESGPAGQGADLPGGGGDPGGEGDGSGGGDGEGPGDGGGGEEEGVADHEPRILTGEMIQPRIVRRVEPRYSRIAEVTGARGKVVLRCIIEVDGSVRVTEVLRSVPQLTESAVEAVEQWRYEPARWRGRPQAVFTTVHVTFQ